MALGTGATALRPAPTLGEMAVVFAPWVSEVDAYSAILAAGGLFVAPSRFSNIAIAYAPDAGFAERVREAGGWLVFAATGLCGPITVPTESTPE
jgi:hypothetical protein